MSTLHPAEPPNYPAQLRTVNVTRYVTPLREGGSLPAIAEAAWTPKAQKDWLRFSAIVRLSPVY